MKYLIRFSGIAVALLVLFTACGKEETNESNIEGIYQGTLTGLIVKSTTENSESIAASSEITISG